jgi:trigger factor
MQVSVEPGQGLQRRMAVTIPAEEVESEVEKRLREMRGNLRLKGFRPGKVPLDLVKKRYSGRVREEVLGELINSSYRDAVTKEGLNPAGVPDIEPKTTPPDNPFEYVASFEVYPEIELAPLHDLQIERPVAQVSDSDLDAMLEHLRLQRREWEVVERAAELGDRVNLSFSGTLEDGRPMPRGSAEKLDVVLGEGGLVEGFADGVVGMSAGERRSVTVTFPDNFSKPDVRGKTTRFDVTVHSVSAARLPELDEQFAKSFGVEDGNLDTLRTQVRSKMSKDLTNAVRTQVKQQVLEGLLKAHPLEVPQALVAQEIEALKQQVLSSMKRKGAQSAEQLADALFEDNARRRVKLGLLMAEVARRQALKTDPSQVRAIIEEQAEDYEHPEELVRWYYSQPELHKQAEMAAMENQVVDWVLRQARVIDVPSDFETVVKGSSQP